MKKILTSIILTLTVCSLLFAQRPEIIDDMGAVTGAKQPRWLPYVSEASKIKEELYPNKVPFVYEIQGKDLRYLKRQANSTGAAADYARTMSTAVRATAAEMAEGYDEQIVSTQFAELVETAARAKFSGFKKEGEWWVLRKFADGREEYSYYVLYLIDEVLFNKNIGLMADDLSSKIGNDLSSIIKDNADNITETFMDTVVE